MHGHSDSVTCIKFVGKSKKLVSASADETVALWEWEKSDSPTLVLKGHKDEVTSVSISSDGTQRISGSLDGTLRKNRTRKCNVCAGQWG